MCALTTSTVQYNKQVSQKLFFTATASQYTAFAQLNQCKSFAKKALIGGEAQQTVWMLVRGWYTQACSIDISVFITEFVFETAFVSAKAMTNLARGQILANTADSAVLISSWCTQACAACLM